MPDPLNPYYLGYVKEINWAGHHGRIRPLARVKKRLDDRGWVVDRKIEKGELGASNSVFWFNIPNHQLGLIRQYVRFRVEPNKSRDQEREWWDDFVVAGDDRNGKSRQVDVLGFPILAHEHIDGPDRILSPSYGLSPGTMAYRRRKHDALIDGPWQVAEMEGTNRLCLRPKLDGYVIEHKLLGLGQETYHVWNDDDDIRMALLFEPSKESGQPRDLLSTPDLADWLLRIIKRDRSLLSCFDAASPGWRERLGGLIEAVADPAQRKLEQARFATLDPVLKVLSANEARLDELVEQPRFKVILDQAIENQMKVARNRIEEIAIEETRAFVAQQRQVREQARVDTDRERETLNHQLVNIRDEIATAEQLRYEARAVIERDESAIREAANHLVESRERIIRDFSAFQGLIESRRANGNGSTNWNHLNGMLPVENASAETIKVVPDGLAIVDSGLFVKDRLTPTLEAWGAQARLLQAKRLHAALLACRWVVTPCASWGVAYSQAIGAYAHHRVVAVEPTWLAFSDVWGGEVESFWCEAIQNVDRLYLLILADADRALAQCWARPLLDIVSGLRLALPSGHRWPDNLRLMACPSADAATLPVPDWVLAHWAGVEPAKDEVQPGGPIVPGHVPFEAWCSWVEKPDDSPRYSTRERSALARTLLRLKPGAGLEGAEEEASKVREEYAKSIFARKPQA